MRVSKVDSEPRACLGGQLFRQQQREQRRGPAVGVCQEHLKEASMAGAEWTKGNTIGGHLEQWPGAKFSRLSRCPGPGT